MKRKKDWSGPPTNLRSLCAFVCSLLCTLLIPSSRAPEAVTVDSVSPVVGTWQILDPDSSVYSSATDRPIKYVRIQFQDDGTYWRIIQRAGTDSTNQGVRPVEPEGCQGTYFVIGDTIWVHWQDPGCGDDFSGVLSFSRDTLTLDLTDPRRPPVILARVTDTAELLSVNYAPKTLVPDDLVARLVRFRTKDSPRKTVDRLFHILFPDASGVLEGDEGFLRVIVSNLDADSTTEIIVLMGPSETLTEEYTLLVLKSFSTGWKIIYATDVRFWYEDPEIHVLDNDGPNKTFYTYEIADRGSGIYRDLFKFYKLVDGRVYGCLSTVHKMQLDGWGPLINREISAAVNASHNGKDEISLHYEYRFWPGSLEDSDVIGEALDTLTLVSGMDSLSYEWDSRSRTYQPIFSPAGTGLTAPKLKCLDTWINDAWFVTVYQADIQEVLRRGSKAEVLFLNAYLNQLKSHNAIPPATGGP